MFDWVWRVGEFFSDIEKREIPKRPPPIVGDKEWVIGVIGGCEHLLP